MNRISDTLLIFACLTAIIGCGHKEHTYKKITTTPTEVKEAKMCYQQSNSSILSMLKSQEIPASTDAVIALRRGYERVCLAEAACLNVKGSDQGMYLLDCLKRNEDNK